MVDLTKDSMIAALAAEEEPAPIRPGAEFEDIIGGLLMAVILATLTIQIFSRYLLGAPFTWTEEASRYVYIAMVFIGSIGAVTKRSHIAIELMVDLLAPRHRRQFRILADLLTISFLGLLVYWGARAVGRVWGTPSPAMEMNMGYLYVIVPVSAFLMILRLLGHYLPGRTALMAETHK